MCSRDWHDAARCIIGEPVRISRLLPRHAESHLTAKVEEPVTMASLMGKPVRIILRLAKIAIDDKLTIGNMSTECSATSATACQ